MPSALGKQQTPNLMKRAGELSGIRPEKSINSEPVDHVAERSDAGVGWVSMCGLRSSGSGELRPRYRQARAAPSIVDPDSA